MSDYRFGANAGLAEMPENAITERIIKCAIEVHRHPGPGLLERVYEDAMVINFNTRLVKEGIKRFILTPQGEIAGNR